MKRTALVIAAVVALLGIAAAGLLAGCGGGSSSSVAGDAVATVGDASVTRADFQQLLSQAKTQVNASGTTFPAEGSAQYDQYVAQIVNYLVQEQIVAQSAGDLGVSVTGKEVNDQIAQIEKQYGGEKKVLALLKEQGMTMDLLKRSLRSQAMTQKVAAAVVKKATVSDAEIQAYWDANKTELGKKKATATLAKATATIRATLLDTAKQKIWKAWILERSRALKVQYAEGFDPVQLLKSSSASPSASGSSGG